MGEWGGDPAQSYWSSGAGEAIAAVHVDPGETPEMIGRHIAGNIKESEGHWAYIGDDMYSYIAVGIKYDNDGMFVCILVNDKNYG